MWTAWRMIAQGGQWFDALLDHAGPSCYELGIGGPLGGDLRPVYVGETLNEKRRIAAYARGRSHLATIIDAHLRRGWSLYYRAQAKDSKWAAKVMQDNLLRSYTYDWNVTGNTRDDEE